MSTQDWEVVRPLMDMMSMPAPIAPIGDIGQEAEEPLEIALDSDGYPTIFSEILREADTTTGLSKSPSADTLVYDDDGFPMCFSGGGESDAFTVPIRKRKATFAHSRAKDAKLRSTDLRLGCSKCRMSSNGCARCKKLAGIGCK